MSKWSNYILKNFKTIVQTVFLLLVVVFIPIYLHNILSEFDLSSLDFSPLELGLSLLFLILYYIGRYLIWYWITTLFDCSVAMGRTIVVKSISELGKYVPGKIWLYLYMFTDYKKAGVPVLSLGFASFIELVLQSVSILILTLIFHIFFYEDSFLTQLFPLQYSTSLALSILAIMFLCLIIHPIRLQKLYFLLKREKSKFPNYFKLLGVTAAYCINIGLFCAATGMLLKSVFSNYFPANEILFSTLTISISYVFVSIIGLLVIIAPGGLGIREGGMIYLLKYLIPLPVLSLLVVLIRLELLVTELLMFTPSILYKLYTSRTK